MKYLLKFNEAYRDKLFGESQEIAKSIGKSIDNLIKDSLSFLIDKGFKISHKSVNRYIHPGHKMIISIENKGNMFTWDDVKSDIIPFLEMFIIKYDLYQEQVYKEMEFIKSIHNKQWVEDKMTAIDFMKVVLQKGPNVISIYNVSQIIDEGVKSILHKDREYPITNEEIDRIYILI